MNTAGIPAEALARPTIGAVRRSHGITGPTDEARWLLAQAFLHEWTRRDVIDRLDGIFISLDHQPTWHQIATELRRLADHIDPPPAAHQHQDAA